MPSLSICLLLNIHILFVTHIHESVTVGYTLCHQQLAMPGVVDMWRLALHDGFCVTLFRDEAFMFHKEFHNLLDGMKG